MKTNNKFFKYKIERETFNFTDTKDEINYLLYGIYLTTNNKEEEVAIFASETLESTEEMYEHITGKKYKNG